MTNKENIDKSGYTLENLRLILKMANLVISDLHEDLDSKHDQYNASGEFKEIVESTLSDIGATYLSDAFSEARNLAVTTEKLIEAIENTK